MLVSWNWLKEYLPLDMSPEQATQRLMMAGLNHESTEQVGDDFCIDLEITSNRPDCLGHVGIAREIGVLFDKPLKLPAAQPKSAGGDVKNFAKVRVDAPDLCPRYTARLISGVKVGNSPAWLAKRLETIGIARINNVVDITNYVLMECGQPLHAFDFRKLAGREIVVRRPKQGETLEAIDHKVYTLDPSMCIIADSEAPVAIAGVMGGASTEIGPKTTEVLIESADFAPLSVRGTSRKLKLFSDSSYRFERGVDPAGIDWASRRCCELILELCGGELCTGVIDVGAQPPAREPIVLRLPQIERILGIKVPAEEVKRILLALGCTESNSSTYVPPSHRRDLSREIDLIEEVARIHGYDQIPEDARVPMTSSHRTDWERVLDKLRGVLTAAGFDEAITTSVVPEAWDAAFSPWTDAPPLVTGQPMLEGADRVRRSIVPSLLGARQHNEARQNEAIELFETARIYLPQGQGLPLEQQSLAITSGRGYAYVKGVLEQLLLVLGIDGELTAENLLPVGEGGRGTRPDEGVPPAKTASTQPDINPHPSPLPRGEGAGGLLESDRSARLTLGGELFGFLGELSTPGKKAFSLRAPATVAEVNIGLLIKLAKLIPQQRELSEYPPMSRDLNMIVDEAIRWSDLAATVRASAGPLLEGLRYQETYRDPAKDGANKKRLLFSLTLRSPERTLTGEEADAARDAVVAACKAKHQAVLLA
jgi:phenylalanyl-tRNA synthetase beta chain